MGLLTKPCSLKPVLGIPDSDTSQDEALAILVGQCSAAIEEYCGRTFGRGTYTEYLSGDNGPVLALAQRPVYSILSLYQDDTAYGGQAPNAFGPETLLTQGVDFFLDVDQPDGGSRSGLLYRLGGVWTRPFVTQPQNIAPGAPYPSKNVKVVYTAGYAAIPGDLSLACNLLVARVRQMLPHGAAMTAESYSDYSYQLQAAVQAALMTPEVASVLARYRDLPIG